MPLLGRIRQLWVKVTLPSELLTWVKDWYLELGDTTTSPSNVVKDALMSRLY